MKITVYYFVCVYALKILLVSVQMQSKQMTM